MDDDIDGDDDDGNGDDDAVGDNGSNNYVNDF